MLNHDAFNTVHIRDRLEPDLFYMYACVCLTRFMYGGMFSEATHSGDAVHVYEYEILDVSL